MASTFTTPLVYERIAGRTRNGRPLYRVLEPFRYDIGYEGSEVGVAVEAGFETDFASIPAFADNWFGFNPTGRHDKAAVIHDALYAYPPQAEKLAKAIFIEERAPLIIAAVDFGRLYDKAIPRFTADLIMLEASGVLGVNIFTRYTHFLGVRFGGAKAFQRSLDILRTRSQT